MINASSAKCNCIEETLIRACPVTNTFACLEEEVYFEVESVAFFAKLSEFRKEIFEGAS
jgi:hypothetical protein